MLKMPDLNKIGTVLSDASTREASCQLLEDAERGGIQEGTLLLLQSGNDKILGRIGEIIPHNAFYTEGDAWSEARRKGLPIPEDVARRYEVCKLELLTCIDPREEVKNPPQPGDPVYLIDPKEHQEEIFDVKEKDSGIIWYGSLLGYEGAPIPLDIEKMPMHMGIFGTTGSGKSFDMGVLIEKLADIQAGKNKRISMPMVIVDPHADYADYVDYVVEGGKLGRIGWIKKFVFHEAYMKNQKHRQEKYKDYVLPLGINLDLLSPKELAETIILYYKGTTEGAELQLNSLQDLFERMRIKGFDSKHNLIQHNMDALEEELGRMEIHSSTQAAIERQLQEFQAIEENHKLLSAGSPLQEEKFVDKITKDGGITIIDFSAEGAPGVDLKTKQLVVTYLSTLLLKKFTDFKIEGDERYLSFVLEEAQNFCPDQSYPIEHRLAKKKLSDIATQGRKFGISLCMISQRPSYVDRIVLSMCNSFFLHRISPEDVNYVKKVTGGLPSTLTNRLTTMDTGEVIVTGEMAKTSFPLLINVPKSEREVEHSLGGTEVVKNLLKKREGK